MITEGLKAFEVYALTKGYEASMLNGAVVIKNVTNQGNNFSIQQADDYYAVFALKVSQADYEYTVKCMVYLLLAYFNKANSDNTHLHLNFRVDL
ncbi:hypothetical protein [Mucilaginibacter polytrichastri]|uniref:Uncharacterized protein n=1 Tax=Mucilaginibacter polytrichastri TaxID=1302689 RepID=A0A1Q6A5A2_9SPHI|nr:hypothetical protein [Mucilaginibacter polytrichastri]OKS89190.1 hypothetical protein RG47T_4672 [Mucilaginibacter polytrichastri]SFS97762.1 hypothetical protein SAMN04487890_107227 [Mucilaginibacter polytrichastri]